MKRTVNLTGKKRITQDLVSAEITDGGPANAAKIVWDLRSLDLDPSAEIVFETYSFGQTSRDSVQLRGNEASERVINLVSFKKDSSMNLYMRVVDTTSSTRRILAESASIALLPGKTREGDNSLLKVQARSELQSLWQIDFSIGEPVLQISNKNEIYSDLIAQPVFLASILPAAVSEIAFIVIAQSDILNSEILSLWESVLSKYGLSESRLFELRQKLVDEEFQGNSLFEVKEIANLAAQRFASRFDFPALMRSSEEGN